MSPTFKRLPLTSSASRIAVIRRMRSRRKKDEHIEVDLSPLIDCVFLLLIFFLVTTMLKKLEKQIPVTLPDYTSMLADVNEQVSIIYALDEEGEIYRAMDRTRGKNGLQYEPIDSIALNLKDVAVEYGTSVTVRIDTDRNVPVQKVIDFLDILSLQGFEHVGVRLRHREDLYFELK